MAAYEEYRRNLEVTEFRLPKAVIARLRLAVVLLSCRRCAVLASIEGPARLVAILLLRHRDWIAAEFPENRDRRFAGTVYPIDPYTVIGVGVFRDLERIGWSAVVKFHSQGIRREDVVGDVTAPLSGDVFGCGRVGDACRQCPTRK